MSEGRVLGHECVGVVEEVGPSVRNLRPGTRVVVGSTVGCGACSYCRAGSYSQCDVANPNGADRRDRVLPRPARRRWSRRDAGRVRAGAVRPRRAVPLPDSVTDDRAILLSDIYPTGWFGAKLAQVAPGDTVAVFGAGAVGQFAVLSAFQQGAGRILVVDGIPTRIDAARRLGGEAIDNPLPRRLR